MKNNFILLLKESSLQKIGFQGQSQGSLVKVEVNFLLQFVDSRSILQCKGNGEKAIKISSNGANVLVCFKFQNSLP